MAGINRRPRFALLQRPFEPAPPSALQRQRPKMPRPPVRAPRALLSVQRLPVEIVSRAGAEVSSGFARASSSCRGWWHLRARFVFERAEKAAAHSGERPAADGKPDRLRDEFRQAPQGPSRGADAPARSPPDRRPCEQPRFSYRFQIPPANGNSRTAPVAPRPQD